MPLSELWQHNGRQCAISRRTKDANRNDRVQKYRRKQVAEMRPYKDGDDLNGVSISNVDHDAGSPKPGDMIARNPKNHTDKWLVAAKYFADNFEAV